MNVQCVDHQGVSGNFNIKNFVLDSMADDPIIVLIAKRASGKSVVVKSLLLHFNKTILGGVVISLTDEDNPFYSEFINTSYIYDEFNTEILGKILKRQKIIIRKMKQRNLPETKAKIFFVMDDCLSDSKSWIGDKNIKDLFFNGRHRKITFMLTMQAPLGIPPEYRTNIDYVFLLANDLIREQKKIYEHYAGMFPNFDSFRQIFNQLTEDYGSMVIVNRGVRKHINEKIFYYKADYLKNKNTNGLYLGCSQYKKFHKVNFNSKYGDFNYNNDPDDVLKVKNKKIKVKIG